MSRKTKNVRPLVEVRQEYDEAFKATMQAAVELALCVRTLINIPGVITNEKALASLKEYSDNFHAVYYGGRDAEG